MSRQSFFVCVLVIIASIAHMAVGSPKKEKQKKTKSAGHVAVVDMKRLFEMHPNILVKLAALKEEASAAKKSVKEQVAKLVADDERLKKLDTGSEEYTQLSEELFKAKAEMKLMVDRTSRKFKQREAALLDQTYNEIRTAVREYAQEHNIVLVLRSQSQVGAKSPDEVIKRINSPIVFMDNIDITDRVNAMLVDDE